MKMLYLVTGANGGLGKLVCELLGEEGKLVLASDHHEDQDSDMPYKQCDMTSTADIMDLAEWAKLAKLSMEDRYNDSMYPVLINCTGVNYIDWFQNLDFNEFDRLMQINVKSNIQLMQSLLGSRPPLTDADAVNWFTYAGTPMGSLLNVISNASHMAMTNSSFYNASKGAQHIATLAMARELRKTHGLTIFGISPNKLKGTGMSDYIEGKVPAMRGWTPEQAAQYQLSALPAGEETTPEALADFIVYLVSNLDRHKFLTNTVIPYGA